MSDQKYFIISTLVSATLHKRWWRSSGEFKIPLLNYKGFYYPISISTLHLDALYNNIPFTLQDPSRGIWCTIFVWYVMYCNQYLGQFDFYAYDNPKKFSWIYSIRNIKNTMLCILKMWNNQIRTKWIMCCCIQLRNYDLFIH